MDREDRPDRDVAVDVARPVERIERHRVRAGRVLARDRNRVLVLLRRHHAEVPGMADVADQRLVGELVEDLHRLSLHVRAPGQAQDVDKSRLPHLARDDLGGDHDLLQQGGESAGRLGVPLLPLRHVLAERDPDLPASVGHAVFVPSCVRRAGVRRPPRWIAGEGGAAGRPQGPIGPDRARFGPRSIREALRGAEGSPILPLPPPEALPIVSPFGKPPPAAPSAPRGRTRGARAAKA